jgi:predicted nucleic acid-binding protein
MNKILCIDTNILIRFFRADHPELSSKAKEIFLKAQSGEIEIYLDEIIVAETIWLLSSFYKLKKELIISQLQELASQKWIINPRKKVILDSLSLFSANNLAYIDCWVACVSKSIHATLETFDKKLRKSITN